MKLRVYATHDASIDAFHQPFFARTDVECHRMFVESLRRDQKSNLFLYPEDFSVYVVGEFDDETGRVIGCDPLCVINGAQMRQYQKTVIADSQNEDSTNV